MNFKNAVKEFNKMSYQSSYGQNYGRLGIGENALNRDILDYTTFKELK